MIKYGLEIEKQNLLSSPPPEIRVSLLFFNTNFKEAFSGKSYFFTD